MISRASMVEAFLKGRFSAFLVMLVLLFLVVPLVPADMAIANQLFGIFILAMLASCLRAIAHSRKFFWFMVAFTFLNLGIGAYAIVNPAGEHSFDVAILLIRMTYFALVFFSIMRYVLDDSPVTGDKICGAVSAYMLMGIVWSFIYELFYLSDPGNFRVAEELATPGINHAWTFYFSFTTLTTLGYGDYVPLKQAAQSYAIMEAACGQIFLAVIIARLIALHITHERK